MNAPVRKLMSADEFLLWSLDQEGRWELVRGVPVLAMAGAKRRHDKIVVRVISFLDRRLGDGPCVPCTDDQGLRTGYYGVRRPDVSVDCGATDEDALESSSPTVAFEVLSPSTRKKDIRDKVGEYKGVGSLRHIVLIEPDRPCVRHYSRTDETPWTLQELEGLDREVDLAAIGVRLPLTEIYRGLALDAP